MTSEREPFKTSMAVKFMTKNRLAHIAMVAKTKKAAPAMRASQIEKMCHIGAA